MRDLARRHGVRAAERTDAEHMTGRPVPAPRVRDPRRRPPVHPERAGAPAQEDATQLSLL